MYLENTAGERATGFDVVDVKVAVDKVHVGGKARRLDFHLTLGQQGRVVSVIDAVASGNQGTSGGRNAHGTNVLASVLL